MKTIKSIILVTLCFCIYNNLKGQAAVCFSTAINIPGTGLGSISIINSDFNSDGKLDLALARATSSDVAVLLGIGTGSFGAITVFTTGAYPTGLVACDLNTDGKKDIVTTNSMGNTISVLLGLGTGSFAPAVSYTVGTWPKSILAGDFNSDGKQDIATANYNSNDVSVLLGNGIGGFGSITNFPVATSPYDMVMGDFDKNGTIDFVTSCNGVVYALSGNGLGNFVAGTSFTTTGSNLYSVVANDFNSDTNLDIIISDAGANQVVLYSGDGLGGFGTANSFPVGNLPFGISDGDFNGDGFWDIVAVNNGGNNISFITGDGAGNFTFPTNFGVGASPYQPTIGDFNLDGKQDVAVCNYNSTFTSVYLNSAPSLTVSATSSAVCQGGSVALTATGAGTYSWSGGISNGIAFTPSVTTSYSVIGTNTINACSYNSVKTITVNALPIVTASTPSAVCSGSIGCLTAGGASTYQWAGPCGFNSVQQSPCFPFSGLCLCTYSVTGTDLNGCKNTATVCLNVIAPPGILANTSNSVLCVGQTATLTATGGSNTYTWSTSATGSMTSVSPTITTTYSVTGTALNGCTNGATVTQTVSTCSGISEFSSGTIIRIYPNPNNGEFTILVDYFSVNSAIEVYNSIGEKVFLRNFTSNEERINISHLPDGIYLVKIVCGEAIKETKRIVKN